MIEKIRRMVLIKVEKNTRIQRDQCSAGDQQSHCLRSLSGRCLAADRHGHRQCDGLKDLFPLDSR